MYHQARNQHIKHNNPEMMAKINNAFQILKKFYEKNNLIKYT
jgi:hypothetical protein